MSRSQSCLTGSIGYTFHGSGDLRGHNVGFGYKHQVSKPFALSATIRNSTGASEIPLTFTDPNGQYWNSSFRYVTSGTQLELTGMLNLIKLKSYRLEVGAGGVLRYQVSNYYSDVIFLYPALTNYPVPLISLFARDDGKYRRFSVGYLATISNSVQVSKWVRIGFSINLQNDNKGDLIWNIPLTFCYQISNIFKP